MLNEHSRQRASRINRENKDKELGVKKKNNKRKSRRSNNPATSSIVVDDNVVCFHILCRLPVKSLACFKCVCKRWKLIIEQDPHFINLHLTHSEKRPGLFLHLPKSGGRESGCRSDYESFISADLHLSGRGANVHTIRRTKVSYREILGPITGLNQHHG
ncbi:hypothetical protein MKW94_025684 [Papaver nudicaule]|uniref:F-box domain-containing protein n=1 Tax=Papaver nudicaule TaxID=74823 RepID=A0AA42AUG4_PAPNU|nr:hypothetical protein [Papaver nudicaule]